MTEHKNPWKTESVKEIFDNPWINLTSHDVITPGGDPGVYGVIHFKHLAIGVIPLDEELNTWMVGQWRYPLEQYTWEIPEGGGKSDVPPIESAKRELLEECGIKAEHYTEIMRMHLSNSATDEYAIIYVAQGLSFHEAQPEPDEELETKKVSFEKLYQEVMDGLHTDSLTVAGVLKVKLLLNTGVLQK